MRLATFTFSVVSAFAAPKRALVLGGGGDAPGTRSTFETALPPVARTLADARYDVRVAFDGGHDSLEAELRESFGVVKPFTVESAEAEVDAMIKEIDAGRVKQLLILVNSHGLPRTEGVLHAVETSAGPEFDLARLKRLRTAANLRKVKLAIIDVSCYSGQTLDLADANTCVITAGARDTVAYQDFEARVFDELRGGVSLEDAFLKARRTSAGPSWPQISTAAGARAQDALARVHDEVTDYEDDINAKGKVGPGPVPPCLTVAHGQFEMFRRMAAAVPRARVGAARELLSASQTYFDLRTARAIEVDRLNRVYRLPSGFRVARATLLDLDRVIGGTRDDGLRAHAAELRKFRDELRRSDPTFTPATTAWSYDARDTLRTVYPYRDIKDAGEAVATAERKVYDAAYANAAGQKKGPEPCRDFRF